MSEADYIKRMITMLILSASWIFNILFLHDHRFHKEINLFLFTFIYKPVLRLKFDVDINKEKYLWWWTKEITRYCDFQPSLRDFNKLMHVPYFCSFNLLGCCSRFASRLDFIEISLLSQRRCRAGNRQNSQNCKIESSYILNVCFRQY